MGCDIHFFTERYTKDTNYDGPKSKSEERDIKLGTILNEDISPRWVSADKWEFEEGYWSVIDELYSGRDYSLFEKLAGVRGYDEKAICYARGFPIDASSGYTEIVNQWDDDGHSHSYFTLSELLKENFDDFEEFKDTVESMKLIDPDPDKVRCVFFFDN
jgi:hypothetical protein